jgi:hypothetical protein
VSEVRTYYATVCNVCGAQGLDDYEGSRHDDGRCGGHFMPLEVVPLSARRSVVEAMYEIAHQGGLIDCDYALIERLLDEYGDGRDRWNDTLRRLKS